MRDAGELDMRRVEREHDSRPESRGVAGRATVALSRRRVSRKITGLHISMAGEFHSPDAGDMAADANIHASGEEDDNDDKDREGDGKVEREVDPSVAGDIHRLTW